MAMQNVPRRLLAGVSRGVIGRCGANANVLGRRGTNASFPQRTVLRTMFGEPIPKSTTCYGVATGQPLTEYHSEAEAFEGAAYARARSGMSMVPYHCSACGCWHLAPRDRQTPSMKCVCVGASGEPKTLFASERDATRRANFLRRERGVDMSVYPCEYGFGWHLTRGWR